MGFCLELAIRHRQVETIGNLYGALRSAVFVGAQATENRAKAEMGRFRILHFAPTASWMRRIRFTRMWCCRNPR